MNAPLPGPPPVLPPVRLRPADLLVAVAAPFLAGALVVSGAFPGWWALVPAALLVLVSERGFETFRRRRATQRSLNAALGRLPEIAGYDHPGSSQRLADLVENLAAELSFSAADRRMAVSAAMMQRAGRVALDPDRRTGEVDGRAAERCAERLMRIVVPGRTPPDHVTALIEVVAAYEEATRMGMDPVDAIAVLRRTSSPAAALAIDALDTRTTTPSVGLPQGLWA